MVKQRQEALKRAVIVSKEDAEVQKAVHKMALQLPISSSSLFGGRTQVVINATEALEARRKKFERTYARVNKGGKSSLPDNMSGGSGRKRKGGSSSGGPQTKQQRFRSGGGGGNSAASTAKAAPSQPTKTQSQQQSEHSKRRKRKQKKSHPQATSSSNKGPPPSKQGQQ